MLAGKYSEFCSAEKLSKMFTLQKIPRFPGKLLLIPNTTENIRKRAEVQNVSAKRSMLVKLPGETFFLVLRVALFKNRTGTPSRLRDISIQKSFWRCHEIREKNERKMRNIKMIRLKVNVGPIFLGNFYPHFVRRSTNLLYRCPSKARRNERSEQLIRSHQICDET